MPVQSAEDTQVFPGVMDSDTDLNRIQPGDYLLLENARSAITNGQHIGAIEDAEGNLLVDNPFLGYPGTYKTIGSYEDVAGQSIIYLVHNSSGYHGIFRWYFNRSGFPYGVIEKIWQVKDPSKYDEFNPNPLGFHEDFLVTGINLVDNLLIWTNYLAEPKQMDIVRANETNKKRKFDFFINRLGLGATVEYALRVDTEVGDSFLPQVIFTSSQTKLADRVKDLCNQINSQINIGFIAINKTNYIEIELDEPGDNILVESDNFSSAPSRVLANNFYYYDVPGNIFNRIQAPPFCRPNAYFDPPGVSGVPTEGFGNTMAVIGGVGSNSVARYRVMGYGTDINDPDNLVVLGPNQPVSPIPAGSFFNTVSPAEQVPQELTYAQCVSYLNCGSNSSISVNFFFTTELLNIEAAPFESKVFLYLVGILPNNTIVYTKVLFSYINTTTNSGFVNIVQNITIPNVILPNTPGIRYALVTTWETVYFTITNFLATINGPATAVDIGIISQANLFRARFQYENFQYSVYGQSTSIILRTEGYYKQYNVAVNFDDKIINSDAYASRLKKIILSFSDNNGKNWYDYEELYAYEFMCPGTRVSLFDNKKQKIAVDPALALLQFHSVPLLSKSQEFIDDRIFDGGIVEGYDDVQVEFKWRYVYKDMKPNGYYSSGSLPISMEGWKPGYTGIIGFVYYDDYDRKSGVCIGPNSRVQIPYYPIPTSVNGSLVDATAINFVWGLNIDIFHEPPAWATKYRIVRTRDFSQKTYLMWTVAFLEIVDAENNLVPPALIPKYYKINLDNIPFYTNTQHRGSVIEYTFTAGDRVRIITNAIGVMLSEVFDLEIVSAVDNTILINYDPILAATGFETGSFIEIYSKGGEEENESSLFFEMGECYEIKSAVFNGILKKYHTGNSPYAAAGNQSYPFSGSVIPASILTFHGGVYYRARELSRNTGTIAVPVWVSLWYWINSDAADEYLLSPWDGLTRSNGVLPRGRISIPYGGRWSNKFISGTQINGLNEVEGLSEFKYSEDYGLIQKMQVVNNDILKIIFGNSYMASIYVSQGVLRQLQGNQNLIASSQDVAANSHIIQRTWGTVNPESVALNDEADLLGWDENEGKVWRSSGNGLIAVSNYKQRNNFKNFSTLRKMLNRKKSFTPSVYDISKDEYILTLGQLDPAPQVNPTLIIDIQNIEASDTVGPSGPTGFQFTVKIELISPSQLILPTTQTPPGTSLHTMIRNAFQFQGWTVVTNPINGTLELTAPDLSYNNKTVVITIVTTDAYFEGPEMARNGSFIFPNQVFDWEIVGLTSWFINPGGPTNEYIEHTPPAGGVVRQRNLGFEVGSLYRFRWPLEYISGGALQPVFISIGAGANQTSGALHTASSNLITEDLLFNDPVNDELKFTAANFAYLRIPNISVKKLTPNHPLIFKYRIKNGTAAQSGTAFPGTTLVFNKDKNGWPQRFSFTPEYYGRLNENIVAFKDGKLWLFHTDAVPKNYFGVQYPRRLIIVCNAHFPANKVYKEMSINGMGKNSVPNITIPPYEDVPTGMNSELTLAHFSTKEGIQFAAIRKDKLTPGEPTTDAAWVNGRDMRGQVCVFEIVNNDAAVSIIRSVKILYFSSEIN